MVEFIVRCLAVLIIVAVVAAVVCEAAEGYAGDYPDDDGERM